MTKKNDNDERREEDESGRKRKMRRGRDGNVGSRDWSKLKSMQIRLAKRLRIRC